jgi:predicted ATPase
MIWPNDWNLWHQAVNKLLQSLGLNGAIEVSCISEEEKLYKIHIIDLQTGFRSELSDVGYGFSQILPMVFSKLATNKTMIFEQPELHLHPLAQSNFAEFLLGEPVLKYHEKGEVKFTYYDEFPRPEGAEVAIALERLYNSNQYIIETHSEHVLRGLQVQIAKKNIKISDVAVYYVDRNSQGAGRVKELELQPNGFFKNPIPEGFFDSSTKLLEQLWLEQAT